MNAMELRSIDFLKKKLSSDRRWAVRALERIYKCQSDEELASKQTVDRNNVGFSSVDAPILTGVYEFYQKRGYLTDKQMGNVVFKIMPRYASQLYRLISASDKDKKRLDQMAEDFLGPVNVRGKLK